jgi:hypothetical protein
MAISAIKVTTKKMAIQVPIVNLSENLIGKTILTKVIM